MAITMNLNSNLPIYESAHGIRAPIARSNIVDGNIVITITNKQRKLFEISGTLEPKFSIIWILNAIESKAKDNRIKRIQWPKNDIIFMLIDIQNFKDIYLQQNRRLRIVLTDAIKYISNIQNREIILKESHIDASTNEHYGRKKTIARLQSQYYWKCITLEATLFVKSCKQCNETKKE